MDKQTQKRNDEEMQQPSDTSSYNNRPDNKEGKVEDVKDSKDEGESYMDYNGNSEANAPARARE